MYENEYAVFIGVPCVDEYYDIVNRWPVEGDKFAVRYQKSVSGGMIANAACIMAGFGYKTYNFCGLSRDDALTFILEDLKKYHVDTSRIIVEDRGRNTKCHIYVRQGERTVCVVLGDTHVYTPDEKQLQFLENASVVYTSLSSLKMFNKPVSLLKDLYEHGVKIVLDNEPSYKLPDWESYMPYCYLASFNEHAIALYGSGMSEEEFSQKLMVLGVKVVAETFGSDGCRIITKHETVEVPACIVDPVDTTGAGDTFNASLIYALQKKYSLKEAAEFATAAAGRAVTFLGGRGGITDEDTVKKFMNEQQKNKVL